MRCWMRLRLSRKGLGRWWWTAAVCEVLVVGSAGSVRLGLAGPFQAPWVAIWWLWSFARL